MIEDPHFILNALRNFCAKATSLSSDFKLRVSFCGQQHPKFETAIRLMYLPSFFKLHFFVPPQKQKS
jgi:hypothetical protein